MSHAEGGRTSWLPLILALALVAVYLFCTVVAYTSYPSEFSPFHNDTISELGNPDLNHHGAAIYNIGSSVTGVLAILLFLSLGVLRGTVTVAQRALMTIVQVLGMLAGFGLIMLAVFPENLYEIHRFWSGIVFVGFGCAIFFSPLALHRPGVHTRWLVYLAVVSCVVDLASLAIYEAHWIEWLTVALFMTYMVVMGVYGASLPGVRRTPRLPDSG